MGGVPIDVAFCFSEEILGNVRDIVKDSVDSAIQSHAQKQVAATIKLIKKQDLKAEKRFNVIEKDIADLHRDQAACERKQEVHWEAIQNLQKAVAVAEATIPIKDKLDLYEFNR